MKIKIYLYAILASVALFAVSCVDAELEVEPDVEEKPFVEGELMVKFTPEVAEIVSQMSRTTRGAVTRSGVPSVDEVLDVIGTFDVERLFPVDSRSEQRTHESGLDRWYVVRFSGEYTTEEVALRLQRLGEVQKIDFNRTIKRAYNRKATPLSAKKMQRMAKATRAGGMNDPLLGMQWNLINDGTMFTTGDKVKSVAGADVQVEGAWKRSTGDESVIVAVLDEGVFVEHPDLKNSLWINEDEVNRSHDDNDNNGYKGDYYGYNFALNQGLITWDDIYDSGHGSHVAGVIAAQNNNGIGISSVAGGDGDKLGVKIMVCQIFSGVQGANSIAVLRAIKYAADNGAVVLQCSWGYVSGSANEFDWGEPGFASQEEWEAGAPLEKEALDYFTHNAGSPNGPIEGGVAVFAAGNEDAPQAGYPGASDDYVSVAATAADFTPAVYTNYGPGTTISAPGGDQDYYYDYVDAEHTYGEVGCILSTLPYHVSESGYGYMEGTSMATPHVSAVVALGISHAAEQRRHYTAKEIRDLLHSTAVSIDKYMTGEKFYFRYVLDMGTVQPMQRSLSSYRGQMGTGQVNADAFLAAIAGGGVEMRFPNLYIAEGGVAATSPARYFLNGENMTYTVTIADESIASCTMEDNKALFNGLKSGSTAASVKASNGVEHKFTITVRKGANDSGWL